MKPTFDWNALKTMSVDELETLGFMQYRSWRPDADTDTSLMLLHEDWFNHIPDGYELESVRGERVIYNSALKNVDNDTRGGYLAYGIRVNNK